MSHTQPPVRPHLQRKLSPPKTYKLTGITLLTSPRAVPAVSAQLTTPGVRVGQPFDPGELYWSGISQVVSHFGTHTSNGTAPRVSFCILLVVPSQADFSPSGERNTSTCMISLTPGVISRRHICAFGLVHNCRDEMHRLATWFFSTFFFNMA